MAFLLQKIHADSNPELIVGLKLFIDNEVVHVNTTVAAHAPLGKSHHRQHKRKQCQWNSVPS